eukprot:TRINITY_DN55741_c0_g1_i1.p1 TRINITY_DN55741_c0_g1~~TRINITY_DN55741_c0_g1_i1.p1  ORF type:complete len:564 (+),score=254.80 TRINITY_DN55741_c0_g1_i1:37-1728(+)
MRRSVVLVVATLLLVGTGFSPSQAEAATSSTSGQTLRGSVFLAQDGSFLFKAGVVDCDKGVACGQFADTLEQVGWGVLDVKTAGSASKATDAQKMYAAGYLEGVLTWERIYQHTLNMRYEFFGSAAASPPADLVAWFNANSQWMQQQVKDNQGTPFWDQLAFVQQQFNGLVAGYKAAPSRPANMSLQAFDFQMLNAAGDLLDLLEVLKPHDERIPWLNMTREEFDLKLNQRSLCSGLIKTTGNYSDLFAAHSAWFTYSAMNRIVKHWYLDLSYPSIASKGMSFSSYPGFLESLYDFYIMDSGLTMVQTTNSIINTTLYDLVKPESVMAWYRVRIANALARTGPEWFGYVKQYNSGTYNNQYMVVDYNLFQPGQPLPDNTLFVCEQIPGLMVGGDLTPQLERGYFSSYNIPYFKKIFDASGYPAIVKKYGVRYTYQLAARAEIFRRDAGAVEDVDGMSAIMRYNNFRVDPYSNDNPFNAICSRGDLGTVPVADGCYDSKYTSSEMQQSRTMMAINGPTRSHGLSAFSWSESPAFKNVAHFGQPDTFQFDWIETRPAILGRELNG